MSVATIQTLRRTVIFMLVCIAVATAWLRSRAEIDAFTITIAKCSAEFRFISRSDVIEAFCQSLSQPP